MRTLQSESDIMLWGRNSWMDSMIGQGYTILTTPHHPHHIHRDSPTSFYYWTLGLETLCVYIHYILTPALVLVLILPVQKWHIMRMKASHHLFPPTPHHYHHQKKVFSDSAPVWWGWVCIYKICLLTHTSEYQHTLTSAENMYTVECFWVVLRAFFLAAQMFL